MLIVPIVRSYRPAFGLRTDVPIALRADLPLESGRSLRSTWFVTTQMAALGAGMFLLASCAPSSDTSAQDALKSPSTTAGPPPTLRSAPHGLPDLPALERQIARFAPLDVRVDLSRLPASERRALVPLVLAAREMDTLFMEQSWSGNGPLLLKLSDDVSPLGRARLRAFIINKGPWSRFDENAPFLPDVPTKPPAGAFYPADATKDEITAWLASLPPADREEASGFFTVIRRLPNRQLTAVPYSVAYAGTLSRVAAHLEEAARRTENASLRRFLRLRAQAFGSNDYRESDAAWLALDSAVDPTIGPYEVYEDGLFNAKAAFEAYVHLRRPDETEKIRRLSDHLQVLEDGLPLPPFQRNPKVAAQTPFVVVDQLFSSGDGNRGLLMEGYFLPNDVRTLKEFGSKRIIIWNMLKAKFDLVIAPLARTLMVDADASRVSFDAFSMYVVMHEITHGLGPQEIQVGGRATNVRSQLQETHGALDEARADVGGIFSLPLLVERRAVDPALLKSLYPTYIASIVRSMRFGLGVDHAKGDAVQLNWFFEHGALRLTPDGRLQIVEERMPGAIRGLTAEILSIQARGDRAAADALLGRSIPIRPEVRRLLELGATVPIDADARFTTAEELIASEENERAVAMR